MLSDTTSFRDQGFLMQEGLSPSNVMDYFCLSPFYVHNNGFNSVNELVRRGVAPSLQVALGDNSNTIEWFEVVYQNSEAANSFTDESIFIIQKFHRPATSQKIPKQVFYVLAGTIHPAVNLGLFLERTLAKMASAYSAISDATTERATGTNSASTEASSWPSFVKFPNETPVELPHVAAVIKAELKKLG